MREAQADIARELTEQKAQLDELSARVVQSGLATWAPDAQGGKSGLLIVRGQAQLLEDVSAIEDLERIRSLFSALETKEALANLLDLTGGAEGVQIFIGSESELFNLAGCAMVIAPYSNSNQQIVGAVGVIGPTRLDYARIVPMIDFTAQVMGRIIG